MSPKIDNLPEGGIEEVLGQLIEYVTRSEEERSEEKEEQKSKTPALKFFICRAHGYQLGELRERIKTQLRDEDLNHYPREFFESHLFEERRLDDDVSHVIITTPAYERDDHFVFYLKDGYLRIFTVERRKWTERTVEKLINYLPSLDRLFVSSNDLVDIINEVDGNIDGFTAKHNSVFDEVGLSLQLHGGKHKYLDKMEEQYGVQPTRLEFNKTNSPTIKSNATLNGYGSVPWIESGPPGLGLDTTLGMTEEYVQKDKQKFEVEHAPRTRKLSESHSQEITSNWFIEDGKGLPRLEDTEVETIQFEPGVGVDGYTTVELVEDVPHPTEFEDREIPSRERLIEKLREDIVDKKDRYEFSEWEDGNFLVFDTIRNEPFSLTVNERNIQVHAKETTTADSLSDFYHIIHDEFSTDYQVEKHSQKVSV